MNLLRIKSVLLLSLCALLCFSFSVTGQSERVQIITSDIGHFFEAYDRVIAEPDSAERVRLVRDHYISKASPGLLAMMRARDYQDYEYAEAMVRYPQFWNAIRHNQSVLLKDADQIERYVSQLRAVYPELKQGAIYFPMGIFRSAGTYGDGNVLLGAEFYLADEHTPLHELPERIAAMLRDGHPRNVPLIALHEFIHTQQKPWENFTIVHISLAEGVAEFISTLVAEAPLSPAVAFGKQNKERVLDRYMVEILRDDDVWNWVWNANTNELSQRDLGYYIGYEICEWHYERAEDKKQLIKELIELDYSDEALFARMLDESGFLPMTWEQIGVAYEAQRPTVKRIVEFENGSRAVSPKTSVITLEFSEPMNACCRSIDFDESKPGAFLEIKKIIGWSDDMLRFSFEVNKLKRNTEYQLIISGIPKADGGNRLAPYTISFRTGKK
jgi:hypothetical protein